MAVVELLLHDMKDAHQFNINGPKLLIVVVSASPSIIVIGCMGNGSVGHGCSHA